MHFKTLMAALVAFALVVPVSALAQTEPGYASQDEMIRGTIASLDGKYTVYVRDERGYVDTVRLHDGTIINPTGLTLAAGQSVEIHGRTNGHAFDANEIDTPYHEDPGVAYDEAPAPAYVAPYASYGYYPAYALSYPAYISLGFGFGCCYGGFGPRFYGGYGRGYGYYGHPYYGYGAYGRGYYGQNYRSPASSGSYRHTDATYRSGGTPAYGGYYRSSGSASSGYRAPTGTVRSGGGGYRSTSNASRGGGGSHH